MLKTIITTVCVTISIIVYHITAQDYQAPPWADSNGDGFHPPLDPVLSYPDPSLQERMGSPDFPQYPDPQQNPDPQLGTQPDYNAGYSYDDEGPGLLRQGTSTATICFCAPVGTCINGTVNLGEGQIDVRVGGTVSIFYYHNMSNVLQKFVDVTSRIRITTTSNCYDNISCSHHFMLKLRSAVVLYAGTIPMRYCMAGG